MPAIMWAINTTNDTPDANPADGVPFDAAGNVSLRSWVQHANLTGGAHNLIFDPQVFNVPRTITLNTAMDTFTANITINGTGTPNLTIVGGGTIGVFKIANSSTSHILDLTIRDGVNWASALTEGRGGAVDNRGTLTLARVKISNCEASEEGGGVFSSGNATIAQCIIENNRVTGTTNGYGGGIGVGGTAQITIDGTNIAANSAASRGGGISIRNNAVVTVRFGSVISQNQASTAGGVYNSAATFSMSGGAIRDNTASVEGGGLMQSGGSSTLTNVAIETNRALLPEFGRGGGVYAGAGSVTLNSCTFNGNVAALGPKAAEAAAGLILLVNCIGITQNDVIVA